MEDSVYSAFLKQSKRTEKIKKLKPGIRWLEALADFNTSTQPF